MPKRQELLDAVQASPQAVAVHDKEGWLGLFAPGAVVNDPVGSSPHQGDDALSRFYDTFIAPNSVSFQVAHDIVCGNEVLRDVTLEIQMSERVKLLVPAHLRYVLTADAQIDGLYAHWELPQMVGQLLGKGIPAAAVSGRLTAGLLANQRVGGMLGFSRGFGGAGRIAKRRAARLLGAWTVGNEAPDDCRFTESPTLRFGTDRLATPGELGQRLAGWKVGKTLAAGRFVSATVTDGQSAMVVMLEFAGRNVAGVKVFRDSP